jgi:O-antigen/teichoic acid export membrane protein
MILFTIITWFENALKRQKNFAILLLFDLVVKIIGILVLKSMDILSASYVFVLFFFSTSLISLFFIYKAKLVAFSEISIIEAKNIFFNMLIYIYPILIWSIFVWAQNMVFRWYLGIYASVEDVAIFSIMTSLSILPITAITGVLGTYLLPKLFHDKKNIDVIYRKVIKIVLSIVILFLFILLIIIIFKEEIITILTSLKYVNSAWVFPYLFLSMIIYAIGNVLSYIVYTKKETKDLLISNIIPGAFAIIFGFVFIKKFGLNGAFYTFMATYILSGILNSYMVIAKHKRVIT